MYVVLISCAIVYNYIEIIVRAIEVMYTDTKAKVLSPDGETELFDILAGVLQGDTIPLYHSTGLRTWKSNKRKRRRTRG